MYSLDTKSYYFDFLPPHIIGNILAQLNIENGHKGIVNQADVPVIMKYACNLACTSKMVAEKVNHLAATAFFLESLSYNYSHSPEHFAAVFNTAGARRWLWHYISRDGLDESYQNLQDIYELAAEIFSETDHMGFKFHFAKIYKCQILSPKPSVYQTRQGLLLYVNCHSIAMETPFGRIKFHPGLISTSTDTMSQYAFLSVAEIFIKRLSCTFAHMCYTSLRGDNFQVKKCPNSDTIRIIERKDIQMVSEDERPHLKGSENLIYSNDYGEYGVYKVGKVKEKKIPDAIEYDKNDIKRSDVLNKRILKMLKANSSELKI